MGFDPALHLLLASNPGATIPLDAEHAIWRNNDGSHQAVVDVRELAVLQHCRTFATREQHAESAAAAIGSGLSRAGRLIDELRNRRLMVSAADLIARSERGSDALPQPLLCIRTCNRPSGLARLLESLHAQESAIGVSREILVIDDTTDEASAAAVHEIALRHAQRRAGRVYLMGPAQRPGLRELLATNADEAAALLPLVDPAYPTGRGGARGWNIAVLAAAGRTLSIIDDDIVFDPRRPPGAREAIELCDSISAETGLLGAQGGASLEPYLGDLIGDLVDDLGRTPGSLVDKHGLDPATLAGRTCEDLLTLRPGTRVIGAFSGIYGELAFDSSAYLNIGAPTRAPELIAEPFDLSRFEADRIWHGVRTPRLLTHAVYTPLLLDARDLLPFAGSWGKADDTLFLAMLAAMVPKPAFLYSPVLLGHHPPEPRKRLENSLGPVLIDRSAILAGMFDSYATALRGEDRSVRLAAIGAYAADLARASSADLTDLIVRQRQTLYAALVDSLTKTLALAGSTVAPAWVAHVSTIIRAQREAMVAMPGLDAEVIPTRAALRQVGDAASAWPQAWSRAREHGLLGAVAVALN